MRELDRLLLRFAENDFEIVSPESQQAFEELLTRQDPEILDLLMGRTSADNPALDDVIQRLLQQD